jgi:ActR/RegA family two-component response regulator
VAPANTVLLVEGDAARRALLVEALRDAGLAVVAVGSAEEGAVLAEVTPEPPVFLVTSSSLDVGPGRLLAERVLARCRSARGLYTNGLAGSLGSPLHMFSVKSDIEPSALGRLVVRLLGEPR